MGTFDATPSHLGRNGQVKEKKHGCRVEKPERISRFMKWITREKVKVDRVACPWLIKNFIDPQAEFVFLPGKTDWSEIRDGQVYDVPGCELGHHGEDVSFNSLLKKYKLTDPALTLLGEIVRAADSRPAKPHPAGEGLRWVAFGFSALGLGDQQILEHEFVVYDALYAECQRRLSEEPVG